MQLLQWTSPIEANGTMNYGTILTYITGSIEDKLKEKVILKYLAHPMDV